MASSELRRALLERQGWTKQQLSAKVQTLRLETPMTTPIAQAVIAHRSGVNLHKYLADSELKLVQETLSHLKGSYEGNSSLKPLSRPSIKHRTIALPSQFRLTDPLLSAEKLQEAREMAAVYPILYVIENSLRMLVRQVMSREYGANWWDTALTGGKVKAMKDNVDARLRREKQETWHQRRGAHPIDYIDLSHLGTIVGSKADNFFPDVIGDRVWFEQFMRELESSRNVVCHMNPLNRLNIKDLQVKSERWRSVVEFALPHLQSNASTT